MEEIEDGQEQHEILTEHMRSAPDDVKRAWAFFDTAYEMALFDLLELSKISRTIERLEKEES